ncbi:MAG TPA: hypothetical protein VEQ58_23625, partial [Polyangiaceae bacterium]|nr:hypothetical protein [Polyangiaceae bacterium]
LDGVLTDDLSQMSFVVDGACKDAESRNDFFGQDYASQLSNSPSFQDAIQAKLLSVGSKLSPFDVANRARFSGSCIGCHNEAQFSSLGNGLTAPSSFDFPQVLEFQEQCGDANSQSCFATSTALKTVFLPGRLATLGRLVPVVPDPCGPGGNGNGGGGTGTGGTFNGGFGGEPDSGTAGTFSMGGGTNIAGTSSGSGGKGGVVPPPLDGDPAPVIEIELPSVDEPVELLQEEDQDIRQEYGDVTISGKSAKSTH